MKPEIVKNFKRITKFKNIVIGEVFYYKDSIFMRIEQVAGEHYNCIDFCTGYLFRLENDDSVISVSCKIIIEL